MKRTDNYAIQVQQAKDLFCTYNQNALIQKCGLSADEDYLYVTMLRSPYRICRATGDMHRQTAEGWIPADSHGEVMTLLDMICDCDPHRYLTGRWRAMEAFGHLFHSGLLGSRDSWAERFARDPEGLAEACRKLNGKPLPTGDVAYAIELFDGFPIALQLWLGDEEFPSSLRLMWDDNALQWIRYETMYFAKGMLLQRLVENLPADSCAREKNVL